MSYYSLHAETLFQRYSSLDPEQVHQAWRSRLPSQPGLACDIGAGSGRDANWLAGQGWDVIAVEPNPSLRTMAQATAHPRVQYMDDALPALSNLRSTGHRFDLILLSAVWMHVPPKARERAFRVITDMLAPGGMLVVTLRLSTLNEPERDFFPVSAEELASLASRRALALVQQTQDADKLDRAGVTWRTVVMKMPDDGTGTLPLLRHIIVNDDKSSTYKLGLLRALVKIAEGAPGMVLQRTDTHVDLPFGLLALYWLKLYMPLVQQNAIAQAPLRKNGSLSGYGFVNSDFDALALTSTYSLRVGANFTGEAAAHLRGAMAGACRLIKNMPARYITLPGGTDPVFECDYKGVRRSTKGLLLDKTFLACFGVFRVPLNLWQTLGQYACWLEPAILNEWKALMLTWDNRYSTPDLDAALQWESGRRNTAQVRELVHGLQQRGQSVSCVWTSKQLRAEKYEIDHCFPWSYWSNNDLWNLMPSTPSANSSKGNGIPGPELMQQARGGIIEWWQMAYLDGQLSDRFYLEAQAALPACDDSINDPRLVFDALLHQRLRLRRDQQLREWGG